MRSVAVGWACVLTTGHEHEIIISAPEYSSLPPTHDQAGRDSTESGYLEDPGYGHDDHRPPA